MKIKEYPKTYEDFFNNSIPNTGCRYEKITVDGYDSVELYINNLKDETKKAELDSFDWMVKIYWLFRKFRYYNLKKKFFKGSGKLVDIAFSVFMRKYVNSQNDVWMGDNLRSGIYSYFDDFFPGFDGGNPFHAKYEYPYKYMNFSCLLFVTKMDERMELLEIGEKRKMTYNEFVNYVVNYVLCYNDEHGDKYTLAKKIRSIPYEHIKKIKYEKV